jgi:hypothetical protein
MITPKNVFTIDERQTLLVAKENTSASYFQSINTLLSYLIV